MINEFLGKQFMDNFHGDIFNIDQKELAEHIDNCSICRKIIESMSELLSEHYTEQNNAKVNKN